MRTIVATAMLLITALPAEAGCPALPSRIQSALAEARSYGTVLVRSTCGGRHASNSAHYEGRAVDFRVVGDCRGVHEHFRDWNGGYNRIESCLFHLDDKSKRRW